jgi:hypothetical protein
MLVPFVTARIEEGNKLRLASPALPTGQIRAFADVTSKTSPSKVMEYRAAAVLARKDMLEFEWNRMRTFWQ